jgi:hypothetical protein
MKDKELYDTIIYVSPNKVSDTSVLFKKYKAGEFIDIVKCKVGE